LRSQRRQQDEDRAEDGTGLAGDRDRLRFEGRHPSCEQTVRRAFDSGQAAGSIRQNGRRERLRHRVVSLLSDSALSIEDIEDLAATRYHGHRDRSTATVARSCSRAVDMDRIFEAIRRKSVVHSA